MLNVFTANQSFLSRPPSLRTLSHERKLPQRTTPQCRPITSLQRCMPPPSPRPATPSRTLPLTSPCRLYPSPFLASAVAKPPELQGCRLSGTPPRPPGRPAGARRRRRLDRPSPSDLSRTHGRLLASGHRTIMDTAWTACPYLSIGPKPSVPPSGDTPLSNRQPPGRGLSSLLSSFLLEKIDSHFTEQKSSLYALKTEPKSGLVKLNQKQPCVHTFNSY